MRKSLTEYDRFEQSSLRNRQLLRGEELIVEVTEALSEVMEKEGVNKTELADRLGNTKGFVSQLLAGGRNLTLRTLASLADALGYHVRIVLSRDLRAKTRKESSQRRKCGLSGGEKP